jgi:DNA-binding response OmpR family regulator
MKYRILAIEDDPDILYIIEYILKEEGYEVHTSSDGANIIEQVNQINPDLIIMDIMLPGNDGRDLCKKVRLQKKDLPVILMSANVDFSSDYPQVCANDFIAKPFDVSHLIKTVGYHLAAYRL